MAEHTERRLGDLFVAEPLQPVAPVGVVRRFDDTVA
jgi:hypothetical protein